MFISVLIYLMFIFLVDERIFEVRNQVCFLLLFSLGFFVWIFCWFGFGFGVLVEKVSFLFLKITCTKSVPNKLISTKSMNYIPLKSQVSWGHWISSPESH